LNRPIGLIGSYFGGTPVEAWMGPAPRDRATETPQATAVLDQREADFPKAFAAFQVAYNQWYQQYGAAYFASLPAWNVSAAKAKAAGQPPPPRPQPPVPAPTQPGDPGGAGGLFSSMVRPLVPYGIKGAIWYQGEANTGAAALYQKKFGDMITRWRALWNEGDFPFLFVQLAAYEGLPNQDWPSLREAQLKTLALPNTGMATAVDIGNPKDVHPTDKMDVGQRLALAARHVAYGQQLVYSGPIYDSMKVEGGSIRVSFTQLGGGLIIGSAPWVARNWPPLPTDKLLGFAIAGADKNWVPADAKIDGNTVVVSSPQVAQPVAVRYGWANVPQLNLYNKEGLPASPFRTDDWPSTGFYTAIAAPVPPALPTPSTAPGSPKQ
jgi:sialate O-acetylesterase